MADDGNDLAARRRELDVSLAQLDAMLDQYASKRERRQRRSAMAARVARESLPDVIGTVLGGGILALLGLIFGVIGDGNAVVPASITLAVVLAAVAFGVWEARAGDFLQESQARTTRELVAAAMRAHDSVESIRRARDDDG